MISNLTHRPGRKQIAGKAFESNKGKGKEGREKKSCSPPLKALDFPSVYGSLSA
jgi:hypothetical protein